MGTSLLRLRVDLSALLSHGPVFCIEAELLHLLKESLQENKRENQQRKEDNDRYYALPWREKPFCKFGGISLIFLVGQDDDREAAEAHQEEGRHVVLPDELLVEENDRERDADDDGEHVGRWEEHEVTKGVGPDLDDVARKL